MPRSIRRAQRDRTTSKWGGRCWYCGASPEFAEITIDHAKPRSRGGLSTDDNLLPACDYCNNLKGNLKISEFRKYVKALVVRNLFSLGYIVGDPGRVPVVFWGEGNDSVLGW